jgi:N-acetylmuramoyl-L-alanine amidase
MRIVRHKLEDEWFGMSQDAGPVLDDLQFIVMHYTAGGSGTSSRDYMLLSPTQKKERLGVAEKVYASAHLVVDRDGTTWQIVPFNRMARHAGTSRWRGLESLNRYSIGIEIANYGWLDLQGDGTYKRPGTKRFQARDVTVATMPYVPDIKGWENYPETQLAAVEQVTRVLLSHYPSIHEIVGHQDIAPGRKFDPGPAFPMTRFRNLVDSRGVGAFDNEAGVEDPEPRRYTCVTRLNIRGGPGIEFEKLKESPLQPGTKLIEVEPRERWLLVKLAKSPTVMGWVHGDYVRGGQ